jgi:hypothetical protein
MCPLMSKLNVKHLIGDCLDPRVGLDVVEKKQILQCRETNLGRSARSPSLSPLRFNEFKEVFPPVSNFWLQFDAKVSNTPAQFTSYFRLH